MKITPCVVSIIGTAAIALPLSAGLPEFIGPIEYVEVSDSPLDLTDLGFAALVEDFEDGQFNLPGTTIVGDDHMIMGPGPNTDSVDGDDGAIDGLGVDGSCLLVPDGNLTILFDETELGGFPTEVGIVWTDGGANAGVTFVALSAQGTFLGSIVNSLGDETGEGTTADDRFLGIKHDEGISGIIIVNVLGELELDHVQLKLPVAMGATFGDAMPYLSLDDSPFDTAGLGSTFHVEDLEDLSVNAPGLSMNLDLIVEPSAFTDSVDGDDGVIDGDGSGGASGVKLTGSPLEITFDEQVLGGFPTEFAIAWTDSGAAIADVVRLDVFGPDGTPIGNRIYGPMGDGESLSATDEDRVLSFVAPGGYSRVEVSSPLAMEIDHVQYNSPGEVVDPFFADTPYTRLSDGPFNATGIGFEFVLEDFEDGSFDLDGVASNFDLLVPPSGVTDSVDGDDGLLDGNGNDGWSGLKLTGSPLTLEFNEVELGGLPTTFAIVWTDNGAGSASVVMKAFDGAGDFIASKTFGPYGDGDTFGGTDEDRLLGLEWAEGIGRIELSSDGAMEVDHVQFDLPVTVEDPFVVAPYTSIDDSPFNAADGAAGIVLEDFEDGSFDLPGVSPDISLVVAPSAFTDSVDGDDGAIDGLGNDGSSAFNFADTPFVLDFDAAELGGLPTQVGLVWTDNGAGIDIVRMYAYDAQDELIGMKEVRDLGDGDSLGGTDEDRFIGVEWADGVGRVEVVSGKGMEFDHVQFSQPEANPADLNGDGFVDGADLGVLLGNWGGEGVGDLNDDGVVDGSDLGVLLGAWS